MPSADELDGPRQQSPILPSPARFMRNHNPSTSTPTDTHPLSDEEHIETAIMLDNRDLEIYVTLPSAGKRLFVEVQEEVAIPPPEGAHPSPPPKRLRTAGEKRKRTKLTSSKPKSEKASDPRIPYATFEHVKLNVRVKPALAGRHHERQRPGSGSTVASLPKRAAGSGITVAALPKRAAQPEVHDRFPIRILGSTTRPTTHASLQATFDLSVQAATEIASLLVLLYTRIKLTHSNTTSVLELNAVRLWHLGEDRLVRLSRGTIASNTITPRSILCYTIGRRTGNSFVGIYADGSKVSRVEVDVEPSRVWQSKGKMEVLVETKPDNAPRRQLFKFRHDFRGTSESSKSQDEPCFASFSMSLLGELNEAPTPADIALEQARQDHHERKAEKKRLSESRKEERREGIKRLETERKRAQKKKKRDSQTAAAGRENLATDRLVAVQTVPDPVGPSQPEQDDADIPGSSVPALEKDSSEESDWDSDSFLDDWYTVNNRPGDECDEEMAFLPYRDTVDMNKAVLLSTVSQQSTTEQPVQTEGPVLPLPSNAPMTIVPTVQAGLEHILLSLGIPASAREPFIRDMVRAVSAYPYIAVQLIGYEELAYAMNIEAKYRPADEKGTYWDINDIQQICLVYKGVWKSEAEDWKRGCESLHGIQWAKVALSGSIDNGCFASVPSGAHGTATASDTTGGPGQVTSAATAAATFSSSTAVPSATPATTTLAPSTLPAINTAIPAPPANQASTAIIPNSVSAAKISLTPEQRFNEYRARTRHRRNRLCPACSLEVCNHSRGNEGECDCGECDEDSEGDEFFKYYEEDSRYDDDDDSESSPGPSGSSSNCDTPAFGKKPSKETLASVLVPGHRARVVQCIYMEAF